MEVWRSPATESHHSGLRRHPHSLPPLADAHGEHSARRTRLSSVSPYWIWCQLLIVIFVLAGMVIAMTKLV